MDTPIAERWAVEAARRHMPDKSDAERAEFVAKRLRAIRNDPNELIAMRDSHVEMNYQRFGICGLTASNDNLLMWAHYAGSHTGICVSLNFDVIVEYSRSLLAKNDLLDWVAVVYSEEMPYLNLFEKMLDPEDVDHIMEFVRVKSTHWSYEKELRLVYHGRTDFPIQFGPELISEVIFGCRIDAYVRQELMDLCHQRVPDAKTFDAVKDDRVFSLNILHAR